jgi:dTDP-L-rhamnose 4-epimerase
VLSPEWWPCDLASVYALNKFAQERMTHVVAEAYGVEAATLRPFNVYGPGQAPSNPYTGVLAIFASRLANGQRPMVFEDGAQRRDLVHVEDVGRAFRLGMGGPDAAGRTINAGSGRSVSVAEAAEAMARAGVGPEVTGKARKGDIRHCFADIALAREVLGFAPRCAFADALPEMAEWVAGRTPQDRVDRAAGELRTRGLEA